MYHVHQHAYHLPGRNTREYSAALVQSTVVGFDAHGGGEARVYDEVYDATVSSCLHSTNSVIRGKDNRHSVPHERLTSGKVTDEHSR